MNPELILKREGLRKEADQQNCFLVGFVVVKYKRTLESNYSKGSFIRLGVFIYFLRLQQLVYFASYNLALVISQGNLLKGLDIHFIVCDLLFNFSLHLFLHF